MGGCAWIIKTAKQKTLDYGAKVNSGQFQLRNEVQMKILSCPTLTNKISILVCENVNSTARQFVRLAKL